VYPFLGIVSFGAALPDAAAVDRAARFLGGSDFAPPAMWRDDACVLAWRALPLRAVGSLTVAPAVSADGAIALIGSGRIDARSELAAGCGGEWRGASDMTAMLRAFERWGPSAANQLQGNFAFAAWERGRRRLTLARDVYGGLPIFYRQGHGFVAFSCNPAALLALGLCSADLDPIELAHAIAGAPGDPEQALYRDLRRVRRAGITTFDPDGAASEIYWRPGRAPPLRLRDDRAYVDAAQAMLDTVTRDHLRCPRPIAVMLSGGFDSGGLAATLARLAPEREILGFTTIAPAGYSEASDREWSHAQALARLHPNLRVQAVPDKTAIPDDDAYRDFFENIGLPLNWPGFVTRRLALARAARAAGAGVVLNGDGGNGTLTNDGLHYFQELALAGRWLTLLREIAADSRFRGDPLMKSLRRGLYDSLPRPLLRLWRDLRGIVAPPLWRGSYLRADFAAASGAEAAYRRAPFHPASIGLSSCRDRIVTRFEVHPAHADHWPLTYQRLGLEAASPYRDRRMVDFALSLPAAQLRRDGAARFLARRALADRLPAETLAERRFFKSFPDAAHWARDWWAGAGARLEEQIPDELAASTIDLAALRARLAQGAPESEPVDALDESLSIHALANALHHNQFIRWRRGLNN
jgi:asparagine synthase (glutamine-hydrolysing)